MKEAVVAKFEALIRQLHLETKENHEKTQDVSPWYSRKSRVLPTGPGMKFLLSFGS